MHAVEGRQPAMWRSRNTLYVGLAPTQAARSGLSNLAEVCAAGLATRGPL